MSKGYHLQLAHRVRQVMKVVKHPVGYCKFCDGGLERKRMGGVRWETSREFKVRRFCDIRCYSLWRKNH